MKTKSFLSLIAAVLLLASCGDREQPGCTDPLGLNHDPDATIDDGSCTYISGLYAGNWIAYDTLFSADTVLEAISYGFSITALGHDRVQINGWLSADCPEIEAVVSETLLVPQGSLNCEFEGFVCMRTDGRLRYYTTYTGGNFRGSAIQQP